MVAFLYTFTVCCVILCYTWRFSCVRLFATLWTVACQAPLSMGFFRREYWGGLPFSSCRGSSWPRGWTQTSCVSCSAGKFFTCWAIREVCIHCAFLLLLLLGRPVVSDSLQPHGLQHTRLPCLSLFPEVCSNSCALSWYHPAISSAVRFCIFFISLLASFSFRIGPF